MEKKIRAEIESALSGKCSFEHALAPLTSLGLGGPAGVLVEPASEADLVKLHALLRSHDLPFFVLGGGSNVLFDDEGFGGVVIKLAGSFSDIEITGREAGQAVVRAGAAAGLNHLVELAQNSGLAGLEFLAGIPGTVGGALAMNAGAFGSEIFDFVSSLSVFTGEGRVQTLTREEINASYRSVELPDGAVILQADLVLAESSSEKVKAKGAENINARKKSQPLGVKSAGSIFKNPKTAPAGKLIDDAGLKGQIAGGAWISEKHANFIVHKGDAKASDVLSLIKQVQIAVGQRFGVTLEPEIKIVGSGRKKSSRRE